MTPHGTLLSRLQLLAAQGFLPRSGCGRQFLAAIAPLLQAGVVHEQRSGAGRRLVVVDAVALRTFISRHFPDLQVDPAASTREIGVARFRDTKVLPADTPEIVCIRAWSDTVLVGVEQDPSDAAPALGALAATATAQHGLFSFLLHAQCSYRLADTCALVENPAVFVAFERLKTGIPAVMYSRGRVSNRLLAWLAAQPLAGFSLVHLPDYDPAGLSDFERLRARLGDRVRLHIPDDLDRRFAVLSNRQLLRKSRTRTILANLRQSDSPEVQKVVRLIHEHNAGLEQEALLVPLPRITDIPIRP